MRASPAGVDAAPALKWLAATVLGIVAQSWAGPAVWGTVAALGVAGWCVARFFGVRRAGLLLLFTAWAGAAWLTAARLEAEAAWFVRFPEGRGEWHGVVVAVPPPDVASPVWRLRPYGSGGPDLWLRPGDRPASPEAGEALAGALRRLDVGDAIVVYGALYHPRPAGNPGEFDARAYALRQGIVGTVYVDAIEVVPSPEASIVERFGWEARRWVEGVRTRVREAVREHVPGQAGAVLLALLIGDRTYVDEATDEAFRRAGISHLMAVSGLHVGLVTGLLFVVLRRLGVRRFALVACVVPWLLLYVAITGGRPSTLRAAVMAVCGLAAYMLRRRVEPLQIWAIAALVLLWRQPALLADPGFQLSFAATGSILWWLRTALRARVATWRQRLTTGAAVSWAAQAGTMPIVAYHFHEVSLAGIVVNLVAVPLAAPILYAGVAGAAAAGLGLPGAGLLLGFVGILLDGCLRAVAWVARFPGAAVEVAAPDPWTFLAWGLALVCVPLGWRHAHLRYRRLGRYGVTAAAACLLVAWTIPLGVPLQGSVEVVFLDVGQGDSILIRTPRGVTVLVDGGGSRRDAEAPDDFFDVGMRRVLPYLKHRGIRSIDVVINTHPHEDHLQGLVAILRERRVGWAVDAGDAFASITWREYRELIEERGVTYYRAERFDRIELEPGIALEVLHPPAGWQGNVNDRSLVLRLVTPYGKVLLTGDIEKVGQQELLWGGANLDLQAEVIKVPHHGSERDLQLRFIDAVAPEVAVIQVGRNSYGQPSPRVIEAYEARGAAVFRTDVHGAVTVWLTPGGVRVEHFRK